MRWTSHGICGCATAMFLCAVIANVGWAGDLKEAKKRVPSMGTTVFHRVWPPTAFPLKWHLHKDGVVNNNVTGRETPRPISNEEARRALEAGFQHWADLENANISVEYAGETETAKAACDLKNIVTWSNEDSFPEENDQRIARGITSFYAGSDITLDDTNRSCVPCSAGNSRAGIIEYIALPQDEYPNGTRLKTGTILDMDLVWNSRVFDFVTTFGKEPQRNVLDIQALATHEFGHMLGLTHTSLKTRFDDHGTHTPTMTPNPVDPDSPDRKLQLNMRSLAPDDIAAASSAYPGPEFTEITGEIRGRVTMQNGSGVEGVRVWLVDANKGLVEDIRDGVVALKFDSQREFSPLFETFTATATNFEAEAGDYIFKGIPPGRYFLCVQPWKNDAPDPSKAEPSEGTYNWSVARQSGANTTVFKTECYDDVETGGKRGPRFSERFRQKNMRAVSVEAGKTTMYIDISVEPLS